MSLKAKNIIDKLRDKNPEKKRCTLYLKKKVFEEMATICKRESQSISQIVEVLVEDFIASYKSNNGNHKKK